MKNQGNLGNNEASAPDCQLGKIISFFNKQKLPQNKCTRLPYNDWVTDRGIFKANSVFTLS